MTLSEKSAPFNKLPGFDRFIGGCIKALGSGRLPTGLYQPMTDSDDADEGVVFITQSGDAKVVTIPQADNAPGKIYLVRFTHANGGYIKDDLAAGARTILDGTSGGVGTNLGIHFLYSTGDTTIGTYGWVVFSFDDVA